jgi:hypothetical protein
MKTLRITDDVHQKLTALLGELTTQTMRMQTYTDAIEALLKESVVLPPELLTQIESFIEKNKQLGFMTKEEFIRDAARWRLRYLKGTYEYIEVNKDKYEKGDVAIKEMSLPYLGITDFADKQVDILLEKYAEWQQQKEEQERRHRKKST